MATKEYYQGLKLVHEKMNKYHVKQFSDLPDEELKPINKLMQHETKPWNIGLSHYEFIDFGQNVIYRFGDLEHMSKALKKYFKLHRANGYEAVNLKYAMEHNHGLTDCGYILKVKN